MIIYVQKSILFTVDPAVRFAKETGTKPELWRELWKRYKLMDYGTAELGEYYQIKTGRRPSGNFIRRWIMRTEIYSAALPAVQKGAQAVQSSFFGELEPVVIRELTQHLRAGAASSKNIV